MENRNTNAPSTTIGYCPDCDELAVWFLEEPNLLHFNIHPKKLVAIEIEWV
ncbi:unnamed protein product [marine sediment metagenome]|uniref:Uncharacterized protein n=1 Tax=marine sediment metagenome TaxID=412755 RepID=X1KZJ0_9ZZZZ